MAFKRTYDKTFKALVKVPVANEQGGYDENTFFAIFKHAHNDELEDLRRRVLDCETVLKGQLLLARDRVCGWELIDSDTKKEVPFTPEAFDALLLIPPTPMCISTAFWETINGARAKNS
jgi:hypothetical protein